MKKIDFLSHVKHILWILLGTGVYSFALTYLVIPNHLFEGGVTGITLIIYYLFKIQPSITNFLINVPLFLIAWKILGKRMLHYSIIGTIAVTAWLALFEQVPLTIPLEQDLMISSIFAGILMGLGLGIVFRAGGTTGGSDIVARIGNKYTRYTMGQIILLFDVLVLVVTVFVSPHIREVLYTLVLVAVVSKVIDLVSDGTISSKGVMIVTNQPHDLAAAIDSQIKRGITLIKAQGFYSKKETEMVYSVIDKSQLQEMKDLIHRIDPHAFITITDAHEVLGEGFTLDENKQPLEL